MINCMKYHDLRDFLALLEKQGELKRITLPVRFVSGNDRNR